MDILGLVLVGQEPRTSGLPSVEGLDDQCDGGEYGQNECNDEDVSYPSPTISFCCSKFSSGWLPSHKSLCQALSMTLRP